MPELNPQAVLDFWFAGVGDDGAALKARHSVWYSSDARFDDEIRQRFGALVDAAAQGELKLWKLSPAGTLALIVVCDQFPRNIFRATPRAFALDQRAQALAPEIDEGFGRALAALSVPAATPAGGARNKRPLDLATAARVLTPEDVGAGALRIGCQRVHQRMLGGDGHVGGTHQGIRAGGEDLEIARTIGQAEADQKTWERPIQLRCMVLTASGQPGRRSSSFSSSSA